MKSSSAIVIAMILLLFSSDSLLAQTKEDVKRQKESSKQLLKKSSFESNPTFVSTVMAMLRNPFVLEELDLVDYQKEDLKKVQYQWQKDLNHIVRNSSAARGKERTEQVLELYKGLTKKIDAVLLERQIVRLRQIALQSIALKRIRGKILCTAALSNPLISRDLEITSKQKEAIRKKSVEINKELEKKIKELTDQANEKLLSELEADQRKQYRKLIGKPFEFRRSSKRGNSH